MKLWTIQSAEAWEECQAKGVLHTKRRHIRDEEDIVPYKWMMEKMVDRIGPPPKNGLFPIWAWYQWGGSGRAKPDLRAIRWWHPAGEHCLRIELACDAKHVLLSDWGLWPLVLNHSYLLKSEADGVAFKKLFSEIRGYIQELRENPNQRYQKMVRQSWERIFDLKWEDPYICPSFDKKSIQATLWEVRLDMVTDIISFIECYTDQ